MCASLCGYKNRELQTDDIDGLIVESQQACLTRVFISDGIPEIPPLSHTHAFPPQHPSA